MTVGKFKIRKTHSLLPWRVTTPGGTWLDSPTHAHAIDIIDHLLGHRRAAARRRSAEEQ